MEPILFLKLFAVLTALAVSTTRAGRWSADLACLVARCVGSISRQVVLFHVYIYHVVRDALARFFGRILQTLQTIFSWETLAWFLAGGGLIAWGIWRQRPPAFIQRINHWIGHLSLDLVLVIALPILLALLAIGRMRGIRWKTKQMSMLSACLLGAALTWILLNPAVGTRRHSRSTWSPEITQAVRAPQTSEISSQDTAETSSESQRVHGFVPVEADTSTLGVDPDLPEAVESSEGSPASESPELPVSVAAVDSELITPSTEGEEATELPGSLTGGSIQVAEDLRTIRVQVALGSAAYQEVFSVPDWVVHATQSAEQRRLLFNPLAPSDSLPVWSSTTQPDSSFSRGQEPSLPVIVVALEDAGTAVEYVVSVSPVSSLEEGAQCLRAVTERLAWERFQYRHPEVGSRWPGAWVSRPEMVVERCLETSLLHLGEFQEPIYTLHARIRLTNASEELARKEWLRHLQAERLLLAGTGMGGLTWLMGALAVYLHLAQNIQGRKRLWLRIGGSLAALVPLLAAVTFIRNFMS